MLTLNSECKGRRNLGECILLEQIIKDNLTLNAIMWALPIVFYGYYTLHLSFLTCIQNNFLIYLLILFFPHLHSLWGKNTENRMHGTKASLKNYLKYSSLHLFKRQGSNLKVGMNF